MPSNDYLPKLSQTGLSVFAPTADQRYLLGPDIFLQTHFPVTMRRFQNGRSFEVSETDLLDKLLNGSSDVLGNRVYVLYAAPGSGKSEMMRWLQAQIERQSPIQAETMIRISRTELDVLSIVERFKHLLSADTFSELTHQRWLAARRKPRTLSKLLVLSALESLLDSDDEINALFYRLLNAVQPYIERSLGAIDDAEEIPFANAELLSREEWEAIRAESTLPIPIEYEQFRQQMLTYFRHHLLEGLDLPDTLHRISTGVMHKRGMRPILLVDDLVQSLNLFATDLLDYFITLEEGNWDVVLGLTPAAFETGQRGRNLLQRIAYLDTIDDRVEKLWLSDEVGRDSYVLTEENCHRFAARYLTEYHRLNGVLDKPDLHPFNREVLVRIYRGLPRNKGKARYFLRHLRQILARISQGEPLLAAVSDLARTESVARCTDPTLAAVCELYGPLLPDNTVQEVILSGDLLHRFGLPDQETVVPVEPLLKLKFHREAITQVVDDEEKAAVRDWLLGRAVNRQLLRPLRQGLARLLRKIALPQLIHRPGIAKPNGILHWRKPYLNTQPPICLEEVDAEGDGIFVGREIGLLAFDLHRYSTATGAGAKGLENSLVNEVKLLPFFLAVEDYRYQMVRHLEAQLGLNLEKLALALYVWGLRHLDPSLILLPPLPPTLQRLTTTATNLYLPLASQQKADYWQMWQRFFDDFFKLRKNLYDGYRLQKLTRPEDIEEVLGIILVLEPQRIDKAYRWGKRPLSRVVGEWQAMMRQVVRLDTQTELSSQAQVWMSRLSKAGEEETPLVTVPLEVVTELAGSAPDFFHRLRVRLVE